MGLTYNGITHRSLEEQVRYDAEQVQLLKQADVTINQNLQTVNENLQTEISGKLTKPTTPTAESAVTMLADGTVGTKPLSEIGGGGKLYLHRVSLSFSAGAVRIWLYKTDNNVIDTLEKIRNLIGSPPSVIGMYDAPADSGVVTLFITTNTIDIYGVVAKADKTANVIQSNNVTVTDITDNITEV